MRDKLSLLFIKIWFIGYTNRDESYVDRLKCTLEIQCRVCQRKHQLLVTSMYRTRTVRPSKHHLSRFKHVKAVFNWMKIRILVNLQATLRNVLSYFSFQLDSPKSLPAFSCEVDRCGCKGSEEAIW